jgi:hypothetical protein
VYRDTSPASAAETDDVEACQSSVPASSCKCLNLRSAARSVPQRAALQHSAIPIRGPSLAPFDDRGYSFSLIVVSANRMKLGPGGRSQAQAMSPQPSLVIK